MAQSVRLSAQPTAKQKREFRPPDVPTPDQRLYGIFGPSYAGYLAQTAGAQGPTDSAALAAGNASALGNQAIAERREYADMMRSAQELQERLQRNSATYGILSDIGERNVDYTKLGMGGAERIVIDPETGEPSIEIDPIKQAVTNADVLNTNQSERFGNQATAIKTLGEAGYGLPPADVGKIITPPTQPEAFEVSPYMTPSDATQRYTADEGLTAEEQMQIAAIKGSDKDDDYAEVTFNRDATGRPIGLTYKGNPDQIANTRQRLQEQGIDPDTGKGTKPLISPNAGTRGGGVPAIPAAPKTTDKVDIKKVSELGSRFGQVTSTQRSPKHNREVGGVKNSYHLSGRAVDIARSKGVKHKDIEAAYKQAGYKIIESLDEGDHSHFAFAGGPLNDNATEHVYATRLKQHPLVAQVQIVDGQTLVTMKDGTQRVYQRGRRIGG